jgi:glucosamine-6-phosphate deaminase
MIDVPVALRRFHAGRLAVEVYATRTALGRAAGLAAADHLRSLLVRQKQVRAIFACAPSQDGFFATLTNAVGIDWQRVVAFHMDEYVGLAAEHPASFRTYLRDHLTSLVPLGRVHEIAGDAGDGRAECQRYARLLQQEPIDFVCLGIGENGHVAFNDPPVADFRDPQVAKVVELDRVCRTQQVNDGCFPTLNDVPQRAITLTVPALLSGARLFCMVPGPRKASAVKAALEGPVTTACPASILRTHLATSLFLDRDSASLLAP